MDRISELEMAVRLVKNSVPKEMHEQMREAFQRAMEAEERPYLICEEDFTRRTREMLGAKNEPKEEIPLDAEDAEHLSRKISFSIGNRKCNNTILR